MTRTTEGPWRLGGRGEFLVWLWRTGRSCILSLAGWAVRSTELGQHQWNSGGHSAPDGIKVRWLNLRLLIIGSDRGRTAWCTLTVKLEPVGSDSGKPVSGPCIRCAVERVILVGPRCVPKNHVSAYFSFFNFVLHQLVDWGESNSSRNWWRKIGTELNSSQNAIGQEVHVNVKVIISTASS